MRTHRWPYGPCLTPSSRRKDIRVIRDDFFRRDRGCVFTTRWRGWVELPIADDPKWTRFPLLSLSNRARFDNQLPRSLEIIQRRPSYDQRHTTMKYPLRWPFSHNQLIFFYYAMIAVPSWSSWYMTHCKRSWNFIFSDIFSIIGQFDTVFFASPLLGKSPGTLPHCIDKFGKPGISFNDFLL